MQEISKKEFMKIFKPFLDKYQRDETDSRILDFFNDLKLYDIADIENGLHEWAERNNKFPTPNEILGYVFCAVDQKEKRVYDTSAAAAVDEAKTRTPLCRRLKDILGDFLHGRITKEEMLQRAETAKIEHGYDTSMPYRKSPDEIFSDEGINQSLLISYIKKSDFLKSRTYDEEQESRRSAAVLREYGWWITGVKNNDLVVKGLSTGAWRDASVALLNNKF